MSFNNLKILGFFTYKDYLNSDLWKDKSNHLILKKGYCELCGYAKNLVVHHKTYYNVGNESESDLIVVCSYCHENIHKSSEVLQ